MGCLKENDKGVLIILERTFFWGGGGGGGGGGGWGGWAFETMNRRWGDRTGRRS